MAIDRDGRMMTLVCDLGYEYGDEFDAEDFQPMISHHKRLGWLVLPDPAGGWCHYCPGCKQDAKNTSAFNDFKRRS